MLQWKAYDSLSDEEEPRPAARHAAASASIAASVAPRPFTEDEDLLILTQFRRKQSCRQIAKLLPERTRVAINKRLKKLLRMSESKRGGNQAQPSAAVSSAFRTPQPKGSKSRWSADDDKYLREGGCVKSMAEKYGCPIWHVTRRKTALERKQREADIHTRRMAEKEE